MGVQVEFESGGRTYRVEPPSLLRWEVSFVSLLRDKISLNIDLLTGDEIFVSWGDIAVLRQVKSE
jgi:hypothetical protein